MVRRYCRAVLSALAFACLATPAGAADPDLKGPLVLKDQGSFFVGGQDTKGLVTGAAPLIPGFPKTDVYHTGQMYVQFQVPLKSTDKIPIVLLHGCCLSGKTYEDTPDGRMGWAEYFVRKHHAVYVPDQASRARSGFNLSLYDDVLVGRRPPSALPNMFTFGREGAWDLFRFGPKYPEVFPGEQFPVEAIGDFANQVIPDLNATLPFPNPTYDDFAKLATIAGGAVLVGHSESGFFPEYAALTDSSKVKGMISIEGQCPVLNDSQISNLAKIPVLVVFGDNLDKAGLSRDLWVSSLRGCRDFVKRINAAGGKATLAQLPNLGFKGNSHMLMQDRNNLEIAAWMLGWIEGTVNQRHTAALIGKNRNAPDE